MLAHDVVTDGSRTAIFLHGILGNKNNWKSFCKRTHDVRCVVVDLRGHGASHGLPGPNTVEQCAQDVLALPFVPDVVVGHSFGGKVALEIARAGIAVAALDCPPGVRAMNGTGDVERVIAAIARVEMPVATRKELVERLRALGLSEQLCQWMTTNLRATDAGLVWSFDLALIGELLQSFAQRDAWDVLENARAPVHVVRANRGARFTPEDIARLDAIARVNANVHAHVVEDAGHWLHTDNPEGVLAILAPILAGTA
jgi:pimeloyl-ACP methyl ester carboxylesterase